MAGATTIPLAPEHGNFYLDMLLYPLMVLSFIVSVLAGIGNIRCLVAERVVANLQLPCKFASAGCEEVQYSFHVSRRALFVHKFRAEEVFRRNFEKSVSYVTVGSQIL